MDTVSLSDAKSRFAHLVQAAEAGQVVHISRHDKPVAALHQLECSQALGDAIDRWRLAGRSGCDEDWPLASDPSADQEVASWRHPAPGRSA